ncbi:MAG: BrnA antitoxin family protein, partial [Proteobacteria bacterium]|nr:BrnA antitoxin family protein [Pseudomonadota bacterium]
MHIGFADADQVAANIVENFKDQGLGWQSRINAALRKQAKLKKP